MDEGEVTVRLVRIEERLDALRAAIQFGDNSSAALVQLLKGEVEHVGRDLTNMGNLNREAHHKLQMLLDEHGKELDRLDRFQSKLIGLGIALTAGTGLVTALVLRALQ